MATLQLYKNTTSLITSFIASIPANTTDTLSVTVNSSGTLEAVLGSRRGTWPGFGTDAYAFYVTDVSTRKVVGYARVGGGLQVTFPTASSSLELHILTGAGFSELNLITDVTLPNDNSYTVADAEARGVINNNYDSQRDTLIDSYARTSLTGSAWDETARQAIAGGITYSVVWDKSDYDSESAPSASKKSILPAGVTIFYNGGNSSFTDGALAANAANAGTFYLIYSGTQTGDRDVYDEYVPVKPASSTSKVWEKIGDTKVVSMNKERVVVPLTSKVSIPAKSVSPGTNKDSVLGIDTTFSATGPTIDVTPQSHGFLGANTTFSSTSITIPTVSKTSSNLHASASGGSINTTGSVAVKNYTATTKKLVTDSAVSSVAPSSSNLVTTSITPTNGTESVNSVSSTTKKYLSRTSVRGVQSTTTTASKATAGTAVSVAKAGTSTSVASGSTASSTANTDILKGISVSGTTLHIGACTLSTKNIVPAEANGTITPYSFSNVTVPVMDTSATTVATGAISDTSDGAQIVSDVTTASKTVAKAGSAVTVATGAIASTGSGASVVTDVTVGSNITVATGAVSDSGGGASIATGISGSAAGTALASVSFTPPTISLSKVAGTTATGDVAFVSAVSIGSTTATPTITADINDTVLALTDIELTVGDITVTADKTSDPVSAVTSVNAYTIPGYDVNTTATSTDEVLGYETSLS